MEILENMAAWQAAYRAGWLAHLERTGETDWSLYPRFQNCAAPAGPGVRLADSRLLLVTSSGAHAPEQSPFDADSLLGDYTLRLVPAVLPSAQWAYAHTHYNHAAVEQDQQTLIPLQHLQALVAAGEIGALAPQVVSFMGYQPDVSRVALETAPAVVDAARAMGVDAALLVPS